MIVYHGHRRTPEKMAAMLIGEKVAELSEDWTPEHIPDLASMTATERALILQELRSLQGRIYRLLGYDPQDDRQAQLPCGAVGRGEEMEGGTE